MDLQNWFGLVKGTFIGQPPLYVDTERRPGSSEVPKPTVSAWIQNSPLVLLKSPNFVWAVIALCVYAAAPYDLTATSSAALGPLTVQFFLERFPLWFGLTMGYASFWHIALYCLTLAKRPFIAQRIYNIDKVAHNMLWTTSGIAIWTGFENVFCYLWASGRLLYSPDSWSLTGIFGILGALALVPLWRSIHFYFAHRFLHMDSVYKQVHSLHHRNTDVEPFSGLCMHPVEHLYYFACVGPSLILYCSPFAFLWNGVHLLLSPAASHSGYEDHFQSDVFHYMHHRYFECNYAGTDAAFLDIFFGTFKGSFDPIDQEEDPSPRSDAKSTVQGPPSAEFLTYLIGSAACVAPFLFRSPSSPLEGLALSLVAGAGPVAFAPLVSYAYGSRRFVQPRAMTFTGTSIHVLVGVVFCVMPVVYMAWLVCNGAL